MDFDQVAVNGANSNHIKKGGVIMASTIYDVATRAGLSVGAISKYINAKSISVAILLPMLDSTFCTSMISSIESTLLPLGYSVIVCECHNHAEMELRKTQYLIDRMAYGIVLIPYASDVSERIRRNRK